MILLFFICLKNQEDNIILIDMAKQYVVIDKEFSKDVDYGNDPYLSNRPGTSKSARRIDVAVIEDITNSTIPEELVDDVIDYVLDDWGILVYHRNKDGSGELRCLQKPKKLNATMREFALVEAIKRNLK